MGHILGSNNLQAITWQVIDSMRCGGNDAGLFFVFSTA